MEDDAQAIPDTTVWYEVTDPNTNATFYCNTGSGRCTWSLPANSSTIVDKNKTKYFKCKPAMERTTFYYDTINKVCLQTLPENEENNFIEIPQDFIQINNLLKSNQQNTTSSFIPATVFNRSTRRQSIARRSMTIQRISLFTTSLPKLNTTSLAQQTATSTNIVPPPQPQQKPPSISEYKEILSTTKSNTIGRISNFLSKGTNNHVGSYVTNHLNANTNKSTISRSTVHEPSRSTTIVPSRTSNLNASSPVASSIPVVQQNSFLKAKPSTIRPGTCIETTKKETATIVEVEQAMPVTVQVTPAPTAQPARKLTKLERYRKNAEEFLLTEVTAHKAMQQLLTEFYPRIMKVVNNDEDIPKLLFYNVETFARLHTILAGQLKKRLEDTSLTVEIHDIYDKILPFFKPYKDYAALYEKSEAKAQLLFDTNEQFKQAVFEANDGGIKVFSGLRNTALTRPLKLRLLLQQRMDLCPSTLDALPKLQEVYNKLSTICAEIDHYKTQAEASMALVVLDQKLSNKALLLPSVVDPKTAQPHEWVRPKVGNLLRHCARCFVVTGRVLMVCQKCGIFCHRRHCLNLIPQNCGQATFNVQGRQLLHEIKEFSYKTVPTDNLDLEDKSIWKSGSKTAGLYLFTDGFAIIDMKKQRLLHFVRWYSITANSYATLITTPEQDKKFYVNAPRNPKLSFCFTFTDSDTRDKMFDAFSNAKSKSLSNKIRRDRAVQLVDRQQKEMLTRQIETEQATQIVPTVDNNEEKENNNSEINSKDDNSLILFDVASTVVFNNADGSKYKAYTIFITKEGDSIVIYKRWPDFFLLQRGLRDANINGYKLPIKTTDHWNSAASSNCCTLLSQYLNDCATKTTDKGEEAINLACFQYFINNSCKEDALEAATEEAVEHLANDYDSDDDAVIFDNDEPESDEVVIVHAFYDEKRGTGVLEKEVALLLETSKDKEWYLLQKISTGATLWVPSSFCELKPSN